MGLLSYSTTTNASAGAAVSVVFISVIIAYVLLTLPLYGIFKKANRQGWEAFIPIYNLAVLCRIVGRSPWFILLVLVPYVGGIVLLILISMDLAKSFGKSPGFAVGLILLNWIFLMILWLGPSVYRGPSSNLGYLQPGGFPPPGGYPPFGGYPQPGQAPPP